MFILMVREGIRFIVQTHSLPTSLSASSSSHIFPAPMTPMLSGFSQHSKKLKKMDAIDLHYSLPAYYILQRREGRTKGVWDEVACS